MQESVSRSLDQCIFNYMLHSNIRFECQHTVKLVHGYPIIKVYKYQSRSFPIALYRNSIIMLVSVRFAYPT